MRWFFLATLLLVACSSEPTPTMRANGGEGWTPLPTDNVAFFKTDDKHLVEKIDIGDLRTFSDGQGGLKVTCQLRNMTPDPLLVQLHTVFQKEDKTSVFESPWQSFVLPVGKFIPFEASDAGGASRVVIAMRVPSPN